jgi:hypothetical protein
MGLRVVLVMGLARCVSVDYSGRCMLLHVEKWLSIGVSIFKGYEGSLCRLPGSPWCTWVPYVACRCKESAFPPLFLSESVYFRMPFSLCVVIQ